MIFIYSVVKPSLFNMCSDQSKIILWASNICKKKNTNSLSDLIIGASVNGKHARVMVCAFNSFSRVPGPSASSDVHGSLHGASLSNGPPPGSITVFHRGISLSPVAIFDKFLVNLQHLFPRFSVLLAQ